VSDAQRWLWLAGLLAAGWLVWLLAPVLTPFVAGALLAYIGDPLVDRLVARRVPRTLAVVVVFVTFGLVAAVLVLILIPVLEREVRALVTRLPAVIDWVQTGLWPRVAGRLGLEGQLPGMQTLRQTLTEHWQQAGGFLVGFVGDVSRSGLALLAWVGNLVLIPVVTFYLLRDWDDLVERARALLPRKRESRVVTIVSECDRVLSEFLRGQLAVMAALGIVYSVGLWIVGVDFAFLIGMGAGLVSFIPYLGATLGVLVAATAGWFQFQELLPLAWIGLVFGVGQTLEGVVLSPWLVGERIGLHPVAVIFAVLAGGQLFGFLGVLLALPAAAVIVVLLRHAHQEYLASDLYRS